MLGCQTKEKIDSRPLPALLTATEPAEPTFDVGTHTTATMDGVVELLNKLDEATPPGSKLRGLKLRLGVLQAYLALMTSHLSPEERQEVYELARELFKLGNDMRENPVKGT